MSGHRSFGRQRTRHRLPAGCGSAEYPIPGSSGCATAEKTLVWRAAAPSVGGGCSTRRDRERGSRRFWQRGAIRAHRGHRGWYTAPRSRSRSDARGRDEEEKEGRCCDYGVVGGAAGPFAKIFPTRNSQPPAVTQPSEFRQCCCNGLRVGIRVPRDRRQRCCRGDPDATSRYVATVRACAVTMCRARYLISSSFSRTA